MTTAVGALAGLDLTGLPVAVVGEQVLALGHLLDQLEAERLRRLAVFDRAGGAAADGSPSTAAWLRERCGLAPASARERVVVARELAYARQLTAAGLAAGRIGYPAAKEITLGLRDLPPGMPAGAAAAAVEPVLVEQAPALGPGDIHRLLTRTRQALAPDSLAAREEQVHARHGVRLSPLGDDRALSGDLTGECGAALDVALRALAGGLPPAADGEPRPTLPQRRHDALHTLARQLLHAGTLPEHSREPGNETGTSAPAQSDPADQSAPVRLSDVGGERPHLLVIPDLALLQQGAGDPAAKGRAAPPHGPGAPVLAPGVTPLGPAAGARRQAAGVRLVGWRR